MQRKIKTTEGDVLYLSQTTSLGHSTFDKSSPEAKKKIWVLHNTEGPALVSSTGKKEYYFWGILQGTTLDVLKDFKRNHTGLPPAKNPLFKARL